MLATECYIGRRSSRLLRPVLGFVLLTQTGTVAWAADMPAFSDWVTSTHSQARLVMAGPDTTKGAAGFDVLAGVDVRLDPGAITYWRNPGDAGLPPSFETGGSTNVAAVSVAFPAPRKLDEAGSVAFGYADEVVFPLRVRLADPGRAAILRLDFGYAVCTTLCLPAKAHLELSVPAETDPDASGLVRAALARVPVPARLGGDAPLRIDAVTAQPGQPDHLELTAHLSSPDAALFVEAPEGWYVEAGAARMLDGSRASFPLTVVERPSSGDLRDIDLRFTLVDATGAIDVSTRIAPAKSAAEPK